MSIPVARRNTDNAVNYHIITEREGYAGSTKQPRCGQDRWGKDSNDIKTKDVDIEEFSWLVNDGRVCQRCLDHAEFTVE